MGRTAADAGRSTARGTGNAVPDRVHAAILERVRDGRYVAGERLTESRLAGELAVSRVPLREALKRLGAEGVLELQPNRGAVVRVLTRRDISEFFQMRMALEGMASRLTAGRIDEGDNRDYFTRLLESARQPHEDHTPAAFARHDDLVHGGIVRRSQNRLLLKHWELLHLPIHRMRHFGSSKVWDFGRSMHAHEQVVAAVVAGDGDLAQQQMCDHLHQVVTGVLLLSQSEFEAVFNPGMR